MSESHLIRHDSNFDCVETMGGLVDKFVGDAVMALFGVESAPAKAAREAVRSALLMPAARGHPRGG